MLKREDQKNWDEHSHDEVVHSHPHYHVTHNYNETIGSFDHLGSQHEHEHDHTEVRHAHYPHENEESEHQTEAHIHDHEAPADSGRSR
jgi:hypothetical protein